MTKGKGLGFLALGAVFACGGIAWADGEIIDLRDRPGNFDQSSWGQPNTTIYAQSLVPTVEGTFTEFRFRATHSSGNAIMFNVLVTGARADGGGGLGFAPDMNNILFTSAMGTIPIGGGTVERTVNPNVAVSPGDRIFAVLNTLSFPTSGLGSVRATQFQGPQDLYPPGEFVFINTNPGEDLQDLNNRAWSHRSPANEDLAILAVFEKDGCEPCQEDIDKDCDVDFQDLLHLLAAWGPCPGGAACDNPGSCQNGFPDCDGEGCLCIRRAGGGGACVDGGTPCGGLVPCPGGQNDCPEGSVCLVETCCGGPVCAPPEALCATGSPGPRQAPTPGTLTLGGIVVIE